MQTSVLVVPRLVREAQELLVRSFADVHFLGGEWGGGCPEGCAEPAAVIVAPPFRVDAAFVDRLPASVRVVATYSVGLDHIDMDAARARGLAIVNTPDVLTGAVAEIGMFLLLGAARRATESINLVRSRNWSGWTPTQLVGSGLSGKTLGVLGMGRIGLAIARLARAFGMEIAYYNGRPSEEAASVEARYHSGLDRLVSDCDALMIACPLTPATRGIVNAGTLASAKPSLIVVNIARGAIIDDDAMIDALREGRIAAAGLDVFDGEPDINPGYFDLPNVFMLPHVGSSTLETRIAMAERLVDGILAALPGLGGR